MKKITSTFLALVLILSLGISDTICYAADPEPTINFNSIPADGLVNADDLADFNISVSTAEPESVELFIDGTSLGIDDSAPFSFSVPADVPGAHTALAKVKIGSDAYIEAEKVFTIFEIVTGDIDAVDYSGIGSMDTDKNMVFRPGVGSGWEFNGGSYDPDWYQAGTQQDGRAKPDEGECLVVVPNSDIQARPMDYLYARIRYRGGDASTHIRFETDFYMTSSAEGEPKGYAFGVEGNKTVYVATASKDGIEVNGQKYPLSQNTWHRIAIEYDIFTCVASVWVNGTQIVDNETVSANSMSTVKWFRVAPRYAGGEYRLDNTKIHVLAQSPLAKGVLSGSEVATELTYTESSTQLVFNRGITAGGIDETKISLENELGVITDATFELSAEGNLIVTPKNGFEPSNYYSLIIPKGTKFTGTGAISKPLSVKFKTTAAPLDVVSGKIRTAGTKAFLETELVNTTGETKTLVAYISVYKNGVFQKLIKTDDVVLTTGNTIKVTTPNFVPESGAELKAFVTDNTGKPISNKIYTLNID